MNTNSAAALGNYTTPVQGRATRPTRILIADDHAGLRQILRQILENLPGVEVLRDAQYSCQATGQCPELQPDVVLSDADLWAAINYYSSIGRASDGLEVDSRIPRGKPTKDAYVRQRPSKRFVMAQGRREGSSSRAPVRALLPPASYVLDDAIAANPRSKLLMPRAAMEFRDPDHTVLVAPLVAAAD
jgi:DNA-binding NarL/FixJ family response regulator